MGLFTSIKLSYPIDFYLTDTELGELTIEQIQSAEYQTKDIIEPYCGLIEIDREGKIYEIPYSKDNTNPPQFIPFSGSAEIYASFVDDKNKHDYWVEFNILFLNGKVESIITQKFEREDNSARKIRDKKREEEWARDAETRKKWYYRYIYVHYRKLVRFVCYKGISRFGGWLSGFGWKLERILDFLD